MSNTDLSLRADREIVSFDPKKTQVKIARLDGDIVTFRKLKDWPALEAAVDAKIAEQEEFVAWWDRGPGQRYQPGVNQHSLVPLAGLSVTEAEAETGISKQTVSRWRIWISDAHVDEYRSRIILGAHRKALLEPEENHRAEGTGENEWFTPAEYVDAARVVMGDIDLDPATHAAAQLIVQAAQFYTKQDDGLSLSWHGRVWLNPPYAQPLIAQFVDKLVAEFRAGSVEQAVMLTHNYTDTAWFHAGEGAAALLCFTRGRIRFVDIDGTLCAPTQGQCFFYFGERRKEFREIFSRFGFVR